MYHKWRSYDIWFLKYKVQRTEFFVILDHFLPFLILKKWKKCLDIPFYMCTINANHMMYDSWDMKCDRQNFLSFYYMLHCSWVMAHDGCNCYFTFWVIFCPFTLLISQKMKISKKWKKRPEDIIILHKCTKNHNHMVYCSWDMACDGCNCYFLFWAIFCPFTHLTCPKKWKFQKNENNTWRHHYFTQVYQKSWPYAILFLRYGTWQMQLFFILAIFCPFTPLTAQN